MAADAIITFVPTNRAELSFISWTFREICRWLSTKIRSWGFHVGRWLQLFRRLGAIAVFCAQSGLCVSLNANSPCASPSKKPPTFNTWNAFEIPWWCRFVNIPVYRGYTMSNLYLWLFVELVYPFDLRCNSSRVRSSIMCLCAGQFFENATCLHWIKCCVTSLIL